ncbi:MAG: hypothetical protein ACUVSW_04040 [Roseiflexus sp.]
MTIAELLSFLGLAWSRLLIFPGGLCAFVVVWLVEALERRCALPVTLLRWFSSPLTASAVVLPWLGVALLPLPFAAPLSRPVDLVAIMTLLEWPRLLTIFVDLHTGERLRGMQRLAAALNGYPSLVLALLLSAQGTLESVGLLRIPEGTAALWWFWIGVGALILTLPPVIEAGPFALDAPDELRFGMRLRALGVILIAALPGIALLTHGGNDDWWRVALSPLALTGAIWLFHHRTRHHSTQRWAYFFLILAVLLLLALLAAGWLALRERWA